MTRLPRITGREVIAALRKAGFGRGTVVPVHSGETIGPGLLAAILRDCEIGRDELRELL